MENMEKDLRGGKMSDIVTNDIEQWEAKKRNLSVDEYRRFKSKIDKELRECHYQAHLHGETEPTPYSYVANELFWLGYFAGRESGINTVIDGLELRDEWDRAI